MFHIESDGYRCCGKTCHYKLPMSPISTRIIQESRGWIFCSEACAADPYNDPLSLRTPGNTRACIYYHTKEIQIMMELAE